MGKAVIITYNKTPFYYMRMMKNPKAYGGKMAMMRKLMGQ